MATVQTLLKLRAESFLSKMARHDLHARPHPPPPTRTLPVCDTHTAALRFPLVWCRVWLCGVVCLGACTHVVLCVVWAVRVCVLWCVCVCVCVLCVVVWCVARLGTRKTLHVLIQHASVRTVRTSPCVPATHPHVEHMRARFRYTRRRADGTHGGV